MKVYWVDNKEGKYYASSRYFTDNGPPKLYGSEKILRRSLSTPKKWGGDGWSIADDMVIVEGELTRA